MLPERVTAAEKHRLPTMIHKIHAGEELERGYKIGNADFSDVSYPGSLSNCTACHVISGEQLPSKGSLQWPPQGLHQSGAAGYGRLHELPRFECGVVTRFGEHHWAGRSCAPAQRAKRRLLREQGPRAVARVIRCPAAAPAKLAVRLVGRGRVTLEGHDALVDASIDHTTSAGRTWHPISAAGVIQLREPTTAAGRPVHQRQLPRVAATVCMTDPRSTASVSNRHLARLYERFDSGA